MDRTALLLALLADLLSHVEVETIVVEPIPDDFVPTEPANYWACSDEDGGCEQ